MYIVFCWSIDAITFFRRKIHIRSVEQFGQSSNSYARSSYVRTRQRKRRETVAFVTYAQHQVIYIFLINAIMSTRRFIAGVQ